MDRRTDAERCYGLVLPQANSKSVVLFVEENPDWLAGWCAQLCTCIRGWDIVHNWVIPALLSGTLSLKFSVSATLRMLKVATKWCAKKSLNAPHISIKTQVMCFFHQNLKFSFIYLFIYLEIPVPCSAQATATGCSDVPHMLHLPAVGCWRFAFFFKAHYFC